MDSSHVHRSPFPTYFAVPPQPPPTTSPSPLSPLVCVCSTTDPPGTSCSPSRPAYLESAPDTWPSSRSCSEPPAHDIARRNPARSTSTTTNEHDQPTRPIRHQTTTWMLHDRQQRLTKNLHTPPHRHHRTSNIHGSVNAMAPGKGAIIGREPRANRQPAHATLALCGSRTGYPDRATRTASRTPPYRSCSMTRTLFTSSGSALSLGLMHRM